MNYIEPNVVKEIDNYINSNLRQKELKLYKKLIKYLGYSSSLDLWLKYCISDSVPELNKFQHKFVKADYYDRYMILSAPNYFDPIRYYKLYFVKKHHDIFVLTTVMMINLIRSKFWENNLKCYSSLLITHIEKNNYSDIRYNRLNERKSNIEIASIKFFKKELEEVEIELERRKQNVKFFQQFKLLLNQGKLYSLCKQLQKSGFIDNDNEIALLFAIKTSIPERILISKINWNCDLLSLGYLFNLMIFKKVIDSDEIKTRYSKLSSLFTYDEGADFTGKNISNAVNRNKGRYHKLLEGFPPKGNIKLLTIYQVIDSICED